MDFVCPGDQFLAQQTKSHPRSQPPDTYSAFISIPYVQEVLKLIKRVLAQVGIGVALKPQCMLSSVAYSGFCKGGARNFKKFEKNKDQNKKLFHPSLVRIFAQN